MIAKLFTGAVAIVVLGLGLAFTSGGQGTPGVTLNVEAAGVTAPDVPSKMGMDAAARAQALAAFKALPDARIGAYAADYTGLVGYAWQLPLTPELTNRTLWSRELRTNYAVEIPYRMLEPGDILANLRTGDYGQAVVFERWENQAVWGAVESVSDPALFDAQLEKGVPFFGYAVDRVSVPVRVMEHKLTLKSVRGAITVSEADNMLAGPYYALRYNRIPGYVQLSGKMNVLSRVMAGTRGVAQYTLVNRGGAPVKLSNLTVQVYGPNAAEQGLAGTQTLFPEVKEIVLAPGQVYEYSQTLLLEQPGTFLALPRFQANGVVQVPPQLASFQVVAR